MIMSELDGQIWMDGSFCDWKDAKIHILTHTLHYGTGVFEGVRAYETDEGPAIFRLEDHTDRLFNSAKLIGMNIPFTKDVLMKAQCDAVNINNLKNAYIRPLCFYGNEGMGLRADNLKIHCAIAAWDWGPYLGEDKIINGLELTKYLKNYASIGEKYVVILEDIIEKNRLTDFDQANLLPTKLKTGVAL